MLGPGTRSVTVAGPSADLLADLRVVHARCRSFFSGRAPIAAAAAPRPVAGILPPVGRLGRPRLPPQPRTSSSPGVGQLLHGPVEGLQLVQSASGVGRVRPATGSWPWRPACRCPPCPCTWSIWPSLLGQVLHLLHLRGLLEQLVELLLPACWPRPFGRRCRNWSICFCRSPWAACGGVGHLLELLLDLLSCLAISSFLPVVELLVGHLLLELLQLLGRLLEIAVAEGLGQLVGRPLVDLLQLLEVAA